MTTEDYWSSDWEKCADPPSLELSFVKPSSEVMPVQSGEAIYTCGPLDLRLL